MRGKSAEQLQESLSMLAVGNDAFAHEYENMAAAKNVLRRFGYPSIMPRCDNASAGALPP